MSRLKTTGGEDTEKPIDVEVPVLAIEGDVNTHILDYHEVAVPDTDKEDHPKTIKPISLEEMLAAHREDFECQQYAATIGLPSYHFDLNKDGIVIRLSTLDGAIETVVPVKVREGVTSLTHSPLTRGQPRETKTYQMLRRWFYWHFTAGGVTVHVKAYGSCSRAKERRRKNQHTTKLFAPTNPIDDIAIYLMGPLPKTHKENQFIIVSTDRYRKLTRTVPMSNTTATYIDSVIRNHWIIPYGIQNTILTVNGSHFVANFSKTVCHILAVRRKTTTAYQSTNEPTNRTL